MGAKKNEVTKSFAQWIERKHYNVIFDPTTNGKIISGVPVIDRYDGQMITTADIPTCTGKDHYVFKSWDPPFVDHPVTKRENYIAILEYVAATVHFNTGENGETVNDIIVDRGNGIDNVSRPRHRSGIFAGWCSDSGLQNVVDLSTWKMPTPAVETTFYAKWDLNAAKRVVSYVVEGGTASFKSVVKVSLDSEGWASTSGRYTLVEADIPIVTPDVTHEGTPTWIPKNPLGSVLNVNTTFTATFDRISITVTITLGTEMKLTSGQLSQTVKHGDQLAQTVITCSDDYSWTDDDIVNIQKALPFTVSTNEHKTILTLSGAVSTTNKNITYTIPNPTPTVNYKPEAGNNLALVSLKEPSGSYTNWTQWTNTNSLIPKYDFGKPMRLNYTNLQTGGLNAAWAMFGDHPLSNLTMNNNGSISTSTNQVEIAWGFSVEQINLIQQHVGEIIMLYDDAGRKSGFCFEVEPYKKKSY